MHRLEAVAKLLEVLKAVTEEYKELSKLRPGNKVAQESLDARTVFQRHSVLPGNLLASVVFLPSGSEIEFYVHEVGDLLHKSLFEHGMVFLSRVLANAEVDGFSSTPAHELNLIVHPRESVSVVSDLLLPVSVVSCRTAGVSMSAVMPVLGGSHEFHCSTHKRIVCIDTAPLHPISVGEARRLCSACRVAGLLQPGHPLLLFKCDEGEPGRHSWFVSSGFQDPVGSGTVRHRYGMKSRLSLMDALRHHDTDDSTYVAKYCVVGHGHNHLRVPSGGADDGLDIGVELMWRSSTDFKPDQTPPPTSKALVKISVKAGLKNSLVRSIYEELEALTNVASNFAADDSNISTSYVSAEDLQTFKDELSAVPLRDGNEENRKRTLGALKSVGDEPSAEDLVKESFSRDDYDFTDRLWLFLRSVKSLEDLRQCLDDILTDVARGGLQPAVGASNETKLAKYIRKLYVADNEESKSSAREKILEFLSSDKAALNLLSEIGFEKMRKDYINFFFNQELATEAQLHELSRKDSHGIDLSMLWKMHYCLEIVTSLKFYVNLSVEYERLLVKAAIEYYVGNAVDDKSPMFVLSVPPFQDDSVDLHARCVEFSPVFWQKTYAGGLLGNDVHIVCVEAGSSGSISEAGSAEANAFVLTGTVVSAL